MNGSRTAGLQRITNNVSIFSSHCLYHNFKGPFWTGVLLVMINICFNIAPRAVDLLCEQTWSTTERTSSKEDQFSVWWGILGIVNYDPLDNNQTINTNLYCQQLSRLKAALDKKCPSLFNMNGVICYHDNAPPHILWFNKRHF